MLGYLFRVFGECVQALLRGGVPNLDGVVSGAGNEVVVVRGERYRQNPAGVKVMKLYSLSLILWTNKLSVLFRQVLQAQCFPLPLFVNVKEYLMYLAQLLLRENKVL